MTDTEAEVDVSISFLQVSVFCVPDFYFLQSPSLPKRQENAFLLKDGMILMAIFLWSFTVFPDMHHVLWLQVFESAGRQKLESTWASATGDK